MTQMEQRAINKIRQMSVVHDRVIWNRTHTAMIGYNYSEYSYAMSKQYYYYKEGKIINYGVYCEQ